MDGRKEDNIGCGDNSLRALEGNDEQGANGGGGRGRDYDSA